MIAVIHQYERYHRGWNVNIFYSWYRKDGGTRSYTWVKNTLQSKGLVIKSAKGGVHRKCRDRVHLPGMMLHQDGSTHEWVLGKQWDLIVTMDDATSEHYSMFFVEEEGTASSFQGVRAMPNLCSQPRRKDQHSYHGLEKTLKIFCVNKKSAPSVPRTVSALRE